MADSVPGKERRRSARTYCHGRAEVTRNATTFTVQVMNISEGGVRFVISEAIEPGETFEIHIEDQDRSCRSLDCKQLFNGYAIRAEYTN